MTTSNNIALQSIANITRVRNTWERNGYYHATIEISENEDRIITCMSVGELYTRVEDFVAELEPNCDDMLAGFLAQSQHDALARAI